MDGCGLHCPSIYPSIEQFNPPLPSLNEQQCPSDVCRMCRIIRRRRHAREYWNINEKTTYGTDRSVNWISALRGIQQRCRTV